MEFKYRGLATDWTGFEFEAKGKRFQVVRPLPLPEHKVWEFIHGFIMLWQVKDMESGQLWNGYMFDFMDKYIKQMAAVASD